MHALFETAREVRDFMAGRRWAFCIIGGLAVQRWGEPRTTLGAEIALFAGWGDEETYVSAILERFESRISDGHALALARRVLLVRTSNGKAVDIVLGALPFEEGMVRRATRVEFAPGIVLPCCTTEALLIMKAFADRPRDWVDAESIVVRQGRLDNEYILEHLATLCELKEVPDILERATHLLRETP